MGRPRLDLTDAERRLRRQQTQRRARLARGAMKRCVYCGRPPVEGRAGCRRCLDRRAAAWGRWKAKQIRRAA